MHDQVSLTPRLDKNYESIQRCQLIDSFGFNAPFQTEVVGTVDPHCAAHDRPYDMI
jgi:hypothetical protein